jgi:hypothetical protein
MKSSALLATQHTVGMGQGKPSYGSGHGGSGPQFASLEVGVNEENELLRYGHTPTFSCCCCRPPSLNAPISVGMKRLPDGKRQLG